MLALWWCAEGLGALDAVGFVHGANTGRDIAQILALANLIVQHPVFIVTAALVRTSDGVAGVDLTAHFDKTLILGTRVPVADIDGNQHALSHFAFAGVADVALARQGHVLTVTGQEVAGIHGTWVVIVAVLHLMADDAGVRVARIRGAGIAVVGVLDDLRTVAGFLVAGILGTRVAIVAGVFHVDALAAELHAARADLAGLGQAGFFLLDSDAHLLAYRTADHGSRDVTHVFGREYNGLVLAAPIIDAEVVGTRVLVVAVNLGHLALAADVVAFTIIAFAPIAFEGSVMALAELGFTLLVDADIVGALPQDHSRWNVLRADGPLIRVVRVDAVDAVRVLDADGARAVGKVGELLMHAPADRIAGILRTQIAVVAIGHELFALSVLVAEGLDARRCRSNDFAVSGNVADTSRNILSVECADTLVDGVTFVFGALVVVIAIPGRDLIEVDADADAVGLKIIVDDLFVAIIVARIQSAEVLVIAHVLGLLHGRSRAGNLQALVADDGLVFADPLRIRTEVGGAIIAIITEVIFVLVEIVALGFLAHVLGTLVLHPVIVQLIRAIGTLDRFEGFQVDAVLAVLAGDATIFQELGVAAAVLAAHPDFARLQRLAAAHQGRFVFLAAGAKLAHALTCLGIALGEVRAVLELAPEIAPAGVIRDLDALADFGIGVLALDLILHAFKGAIAHVSFHHLNFRRGLLVFLIGRSRHIQLSLSIQPVRGIDILGHLGFDLFNWVRLCLIRTTSAENRDQHQN